MSTETSDGIGRERLVILGGLMLGMLLGSIDQSIVSTALPTIVGELGGANKLSWVVTAYLVTVTVTTPLYGKLSDLYGRSIIFESSITIFLIGSILSGLAGEFAAINDVVAPMTQLALFRALQGIGAGGLIAMATTILGDIFSPRERGKYMSYMMLIFGVATIGGPLLGGYLTDHYSWRWIFYINVPIGLAAIAITHFKLDLPTPDADHDIDYLGAALLVFAVGALMLVTTWGGDKYAWDSVEILALAAGTVVFGVLFVLQELRVSEPVFPIHLLDRHTVVGVMTLSFCLGIGMFGATIYLPVFLQTVLGASATNSGLLLFPLVGGMLVTSAVTGQLMTRLGRYKMFAVIGTVVGTAGYWLLHTMGPATTSTESTAFMFLTGMGLGFVMPVLTVAVQNAVDREDLGVATTSVTFSRSLGSSIGVAVFGALLTNQLTHRLADAFGSKGGSESVAASGGSIDPATINALPKGIHDVVVTALANSIDTVFLAGTGVLALAFVVALTLPNAELSEDAHVSMGEGEGAAEPMDDATATDD
ncbi:MDR family MFS transporter [Haladaptatus sp. CMAA 1911]|uniref:MDR family MFS transporter n=2 Tax=Haladaptatus TaxID=367188 RepID=UPI0037546FB9